MTNEGGGVWKTPKLADIICEQPLIHRAASSISNTDFSAQKGGEHVQLRDVVGAG